LSWLFYLQFLRMEDDPHRQEIWDQYIQDSSFSPVSFETEKEQPLSDIITHQSRSGSNTLVVSGHRSKNGAGMIASDPHVGLQLPPIWLIAGVKSPGINSVGLMIPGLPFFALGRN